MRTPSSLNGTPSWVRYVSPPVWTWIAAVAAFLAFVGFGVA